METYLAHHGILGQKWGVRRYQNYDGSLTKAGMRRYNESMDTYQRANDRYKSLKKDANASKADIVNAKLARKQAKSRLDKDYRHLKKDKLADQGKELYANGKTITNNSRVTSTLKSVGALSIWAASTNEYFHITGSEKVTYALAGIGALSVTSAAVKQYRDEYQAKRLRAYYTHTSNY